MGPNIAQSELIGESVEQEWSIITPPTTFPLQRPLDYLKELAIDQLSESAGQLPAC